MLRWDLNLALVLSGAALIVLAMVIAIALDPSGAPFVAPLAVGALASLTLLRWSKPWLYLLAGILVSAFPLVAIFVFGAVYAVVHPGGGGETLMVTLLLVGSILALLGGILGFAQGRRDAHPPLRAVTSTWQGLSGILLVGALLGFAAANGFATSALEASLLRPASYAESVDERLRVVTTGYAFAPKTATISAGKLTSIDIENGDGAGHTFSYRLADGVHEAPIPPKTEMSILLKFDTPQTLHVWCQPHATGPDDRSDEGMWMEIRVV